jgi:hypothetical protein
MRNVYVILDITKQSTITDFKPTRIGLSVKYLPVEIIITKYSSLCNNFWNKTHFRKWDLL